MNALAPFAVPVIARHGAGAPVLPYPDHLAAAWELAHVPRSPGAPTVVSLFAGGGGSSLGYAVAGYREPLAVEWDPYAAHCLRVNLPGVEVFEGDVADLSVDACLDRIGMAPGELDVLDGSPPCQGFSTGGKRRLDDPRNALFREYVRLLRGLMPRVLVMENVAGLVRGKMRLVFRDVLHELTASGYVVSARLLNAMWFGVPQSRARLIVVGVRQDLVETHGVAPSHPAAQGWPIPVREALRGVEQEAVPELSPKYRRLAPLVRPGQCAADVDHGKGFQNLVRLDYAKPSPTISRLNPGFGRGTPLHPVRHRSLSVPEARRLCGFPDAYVLPDAPFPTRWGVLGNAVPPPFMAAVASHIRAELFDRMGTEDGTQ